jgi:TPR repeat protein
MIYSCLPVKTYSSYFRDTTLDADWRIPFQSESAAWPHFVSAAEGGIPQAESVVGMAYLYRHYGIPFDRAKAKLWLEAAAKQGDVSAERELANVDAVPGKRGQASLSSP